MGGVDQVVPDDFNNFAPRLGFSWDPFGDNRLAIRGGYGIAYERLFNNSITNIRFNPPYYAFTVANPVQRRGACRHPDRLRTDEPGRHPAATSR